VTDRYLTQVRLDLFHWIKIQWPAVAGQAAAEIELNSSDRAQIVMGLSSGCSRRHNKPNLGHWDGCSGDNNDV
jgi:hypothetical protein